MKHGPEFSVQSCLEHKFSYLKECHKKEGWGILKSSSIYANFPDDIRPAKFLFIQSFKLSNDLQLY